MVDAFHERIEERAQMVSEQLERRGIQDQRVLDAMGSIPRHAFVAGDLADHAYDDGPLPIGHGQTISQPYVVAAMTEALELRPGDRVLEIGAGCGYQTAILAALVDEVRSFEIVPELAALASRRLAALGLDPRPVCGDGLVGCRDGGPFEAILVAAAPTQVPQALLAALASDGRLVLPVGTDEQHLVQIRRADEGWREKTLFPVRFVPMTGETAGG